MECHKCGLINPDYATRCDCGYSFEPKPVRRSEARETPLAPIARTTKQSTSQPRRKAGHPFDGIGMVLVVGGLVLAGLTYVIQGTSAPGADVINFGLVVERQTGILGGLLLANLGAVLMVYRK